MHTLFILKRFSSIRLVFFGGIRVVHLFSFMCCVFVFYLSSSCVLCPILPMSLDCFIYLRHVCYAQYCLCLWIVLFIFVMCVMPNIAYVSGLFYLSSSCVLCPILPMSLDCFIYLRHVCYAQYCLCLWIVLCIFVMCVMPNIAYVSGLFYLSSSCVLCSILPMSLDCPFLFANSIFFNVYLTFFFLIDEIFNFLAHCGFFYQHKTDAGCRNQERKEVKS